LLDDVEALLSKGSGESRPPFRGEKMGPSLPPSLPPSHTALPKHLGSKYLHVAEAEDQEEERLPPGTDVLKGEGEKGARQGEQKKKKVKEVRKHNTRDKNLAASLPSSLPP